MENKFVYNSEQYKDVIKKTVKEDIVEVLGVEPEEVVDSANLINDLGADSLDIVELAMTLEKDFNIRIPDEIIEGKNESFFTVSFVVDIVKKYLNEKS